MKLINLLGIGLTGLGAVALALSIDKPAQTNVTAQTTAQNAVQEAPSQPPRHKITVTLTSPDDLKVKEGQRIKLGDVISDRTQARQKLEAKKKQLEIAVEQMSLPITAAAPLPPPNYEVEMAAVKKAKFNLEQAEVAIANYPESKFLDPFLSEIHEPERIKELAQLKERKVAAAIALEAAVARLDAAKAAYQQRRYQHSLEMSRHQTNLQRQQYQLASLVNQLQEVESKLEEIVAVRSPYSGRVRRVKILGQNDRVITAEITLDIRQR